MWPSGFTTLVLKERENSVCLAALWDGGGAPPRPAPCTPTACSRSSELAATQLQVRRGSQDAEAQPSPRWLARGASPKLSKTRAGPDLAGGERRGTGACDMLSLAMVLA